MRYTLDGTDPSATNGKIYSKPIYIDSTKLLKTTAVKNGDTRNIVEFRYNIPKY
ncbi:FN3 associated domain-containing protein [Koleobacter methoxysyntrophicus]|uniref:FN3 associated domain-containing protein n=1 Tax=Koleobacter methoxysyntrophicus TaxID=2751313 RepID=UPI0019D61E97